jgi:tetratricopeptide (TPR) repeat protein
LAIEPNNVDIFFNKGFALDNLGKYGEAITWYDKALAINPTYVDALNNKALDLAILGKNEEALHLISKVLKSNSNNEYYLYIAAALIMYNLGKYNEAKLYFEKALQINSNLTSIMSEKELNVFNKVMDNK